MADYCVSLHICGDAKQLVSPAPRAHGVGLGQELYADLVQRVTF
jgi:hypothetical protein